VPNSINAKKSKPEELELARDKPGSEGMSTP
jgi:hypothetical protein